MSAACIIERAAENSRSTIVRARAEWIDMKMKSNWTTKGIKLNMKASESS